MRGIESRKAGMNGSTSDAATARTGFCAFAVMAKASRPGVTKTRLVPPLTFEEAADFNTAFLKDVSENLTAAAREAPIAGFMAFGPPGSERFFTGILPARVGLIETWLPNFGDCLFHAAATLLEAGYGAVCLLNSDSPTLPTQVLVEAVRVLAEPGDRAVLGPSLDGGYYLLGLKAPHRRLFEDVAWSTERVAAQTLERIRELGLPVHHLPVWYDIDDPEALRTLHGELFEDRPFADTGGAKPHAGATAALLGRLVRGGDLAARLGLVEQSPDSTDTRPSGMGTAA